MNMPNNVTMLYDGDCGFCKYWVSQLNILVGDKIESKPYQSVLSGGTWNGFTRDDCRRSIKLYDASTGTAYEAAHAAFKALSYSDKAWASLPLKLYKSLPGFKQVSELIYAVVAFARPLLSRLGSELGASRSIDFFIRGIGLCYLLSFLSLLPQLEALWGPRGLAPIAWSAIGLSWVDASRAVPVLMTACILGALSSLLVVLKRYSSLALSLSFLIYFFFVSFGSVFMSFQWDALLLETGFVAIFLSFCSQRSFNIATRLLYYSLVITLFKLILLSGVVKLASGDVAWHSLTALDYHYFTQPIPNPLSYFVHQLPAWFDYICCALMFVIELVLPWFIFLGGDLNSKSWFAVLRARLRYSAAIAFIILQFIIISTGNYCFFNLLTICLSLLVLDDNFWTRLRLPAKRCSMTAVKPFQLATILLTPLTSILVFLLIYINLIFVNQPLAVLLKTKPWINVQSTDLLFQPLNLIYRNHIASPYGLFAVMTKERREIIIQGSNDGQNWLDYEFKYKPGNLYRMPAQIAPMQPRIDWQMWFAALSPWQQNIWFVNLCMRLLEGESSVSKQLAYNPYTARAPKYIRAISYRYEFTDLAELARTGAYWKRSNPRLYLPVISLRR